MNNLEQINRVMEEIGPIKVSFINYDEVIEKYTAYSEVSWWFDQNYHSKGSKIQTITTGAKPRMINKMIGNSKECNSEVDAIFNKDEMLIFAREDFKSTPTGNYESEKILYIYIPS